MPTPKPHSSDDFKDNYVMETIKTNEPEAKNISSQTKSNWDMTFIYKVWRKKYTIPLTNLEYEKYIADKKKDYVEPIKQYHEELEEATKPIREKHEDMLKEYQEMLSKETEQFVVWKINNYFKK